MDVAIVGVGLHPFGRHDGVSGLAMGVQAARNALHDAGVGWSDVQFAVGGSMGGVLGEPQAPTPDALVGELGLTGLPFVNVTNACATAGTAVDVAAQSLISGKYDVVMALGFDKHPRGHFNLGSSFAGLPSWYAETGMMVTTQFFAMKTHRYMHDHGISHRSLARVAAKAYRNGAANGNAWRRKPFTEEEILTSRMLNYPLTQYMFCSPDEGAGAVVLCRADHAHRYTDRPIYLRAATTRTRRFGTFEVFSPSLAPDSPDSPTVEAVRACYEQAGVGPEDIDIAQVQDSDSGSEIIQMAETGLCEHGEQESMIERRETDIGGRLPVNTDGGLLANGEPVGASGMRQIHEITLQLRGDAGSRQVPGTLRTGLTQVYGAPGIAGCTIMST
ncbi:Acetyl-CoA acetyltransferase [Haloechinothrix alba]|uniref:Acetyl-CoA acetyltransferase n=2 Tax=Haloechinothrix alba TaxID=664784 RepID=A0A238Y3T0_9PSEU|nr:Acetyl-CoA acetyltransferase [Haloechinothrix alba]